MEHFPAINQDPIKYTYEQLEQCDYYILIQGGKYGSIVRENDKSYTHLEFIKAKELGIPRITLLAKELQNLKVSQSENRGARQKLLKEFIDDVKKGFVVGFWETELEIPYKVLENIPKIISEFPRSGWTRERVYQSPSNSLRNLQEWNRSIRGSTNEIIEKEAEYRLTVLDTLLERIAGDAEAIVKDNFSIHVQAPFEKIRTVLGDLMKKLQSNESYITISSLDFWVTDMRGDETFIDHNIDAVESGVKIDRVIIIDRKLIENPYRHKHDLIKLDNLLQFFARTLSFREHDNLSTKFLVTDLSKVGIQRFPMAIIYDTSLFEKAKQAKMKLDIADPLWKKYMQVVPVLSHGKIKHIEAIEFKFPDRVNYVSMFREHQNVQAIIDRSDLLSIPNLSKKLDEIDAEYSFRRMDRTLSMERCEITTFEGSYSIVNGNVDFEVLGTDVSNLRILIKEDDGTYTVVDKTEIINALVARKALCPYERRTRDNTKNQWTKDDNWRLIQLEIPDALEVSGFISKISNLFAQEGISICLYSMVSSEYIMMKGGENFIRGMGLLFDQKMISRRADGPIE